MRDLAELRPSAGAEECPGHVLGVPSRWRLYQSARAGWNMRSVGVVGERQPARCQAHEVLGVDVLGALDHGPFALALAQRDVVLDHLALGRVDLERLLEGVLGGAVAVGAFQDAAELLSGRSALCLTASPLTAARAFHQLHPLRHREPGWPASSSWRPRLM